MQAIQTQVIKFLHKFFPSINQNDNYFVLDNDKVFYFFQDILYLKFTKTYKEKEIYLNENWKKNLMHYINKFELYNNEIEKQLKNLLPSIEKVGSNYYFKMKSGATALFFNTNLDIFCSYENKDQETNDYESYEEKDHLELITIDENWYENLKEYIIKHKINSKVIIDSNIIFRENLNMDWRSFSTESYKIVYGLRDGKRYMIFKNKRDLRHKMPNDKKIKFIGFTKTEIKNLMKQINDALEMEEFDIKL